MGQYLYEIIKDCCEKDEYRGGLVLLPAPTGSGKTHSAKEYMGDTLAKEFKEVLKDRKRINKRSRPPKLIFITPLKKNIPEEKLREYLAEIGVREDYVNEKVLRVPAVTDSFIDAIESDYSDFPKWLVKSKQFKETTTCINLKEKYHKSGEFLAEQEKLEALSRIHIPAIRTLIRAKLKGVCRAKNGTIDIKSAYSLVKYNEDWKWVGRLFPSVYLDDATIVMMSVDKFLANDTTPIEARSAFYNSDAVKDSIIFIDEFDSTKEWILAHIVKEGLKDKVDNVKLFHNIYSSLNNKELTANLIDKYDDNVTENYKSRLEDLTARADKIYKEFSLMFSFKTSVITDSDASNFLFNDYKYHSIIDGKKFVVIKTDEKEKKNILKFRDLGPKTEAENLDIFLTRTENFISSFIKLVLSLAQSYRNESYNLSLTSAVYTVLDEFEVDEAFKTPIVNRALQIPPKRSKKRAVQNAYDGSVYERGFSYHDFHDSDLHAEKTKIIRVSYDMTPEKLLLQVCDRARLVIGISATATVSSRISNYDIDYLKYRLGKKYFDSTIVHKGTLEKLKKEIFSGYEDVNIHAEFIGDEAYSVDSWRKLCDDEEFALNLLGIVSPASQSKFVEERYYRIASAFHKFIVYDDIHSFLCMLNKHPEEIMPSDLCKKVLNALFKSIADFYQVEFKTDMVSYLTGCQYEENKDKILKRLADGERIFVISAYQTMGAGQNIQYTIPTELEDLLIHIGVRDGEKEKDFDAIYVDNPTNIMPFLSDNDEHPFETAMLRIFKLEMLMGTEISTADATKDIKNVFKRLGCQQFEPWSKSLKCLPSQSKAVTAIIIQAIGRICRTNNKMKNVYVFADRAIAEYIDVPACEQLILNPEFEALLSLVRAKQSGKKSSEEEQLLISAEHKTVLAARYIKKLARTPYNDEEINAWHLYRDFLAMNPNASDDTEDPNGIIHNWYNETPTGHIHYKQEGDYTNVNISFEKRSGFSEISAEDCRLIKFMEDDYLRNWFEQNNYATELKHTKYQMNPYIYNSIYKGVLGELVGKALFEEMMDMSLEDIVEVKDFEKFDFIIPNTNVYIDFKNWHERTDKDATTYNAHIINKAKAVGSSCVIIANVLGPEKFKNVRRNVCDGVEIIIIPALLYEKDGRLVRNAEAWDMIGRSINEYAD